MGDKKDKKKISKEDIKIKVKIKNPDKNTEKLSDIKIASTLPLFQLPLELQDAPENVKKLYIEYLEVDRIIKESTDRYFQFINSITGEMEQVDLMGLAGHVQKLAIKKNIEEVDLELLNSKIGYFQELKIEKNRKKQNWSKYTAPIIGKDVLQWKKAEIMDLYAKFYTHDEIYEKLKGDGYEVRIHNLYKFFLANKDTIDKKRMEFMSSSKDFYIATDAGRLESLSTIHNKLMILFKKYSENNTSSQNTQEIRQLSSAICNVLEHARKEVKGDEIKLTIDGKIDINASIQANTTIREITKKIPINLIVVYMVAAKQGIDPSMIITSLVNSFYRDFNGFGIVNEISKPADTAELIKNYDWSQIKTYQQSKKEEVGTIVEYEEITEVQRVTVLSQKESLLKMLEQQKLAVQNES